MGKEDLACGDGLAQPAVYASAEHCSDHRPSRSLEIDPICRICTDTNDIGSQRPNLSQGGDARKSIHQTRSKKEPHIILQ